MVSQPIPPINAGISKRSIAFCCVTQTTTSRFSLQRLLRQELIFRFQSDCQHGAECTGDPERKLARAGSRIMWKRGLFRMNDPALPANRLWLQFRVNHCHQLKLKD